MYAKSRTHPEGLPKGLFPHCEVRTCLSECEESHNGPRYSVQERTTGAIYELRCCSLTSMEDDEDSTPAHDKQTQRMEALMQAATHVVNAFTLNMDLSGRRRSTTKVSGTPLCVQLPPVVVEHLDPATGEPYVACLDHFSGLSLGDIARSGWNVVDEQTFFEILAAVEEYGCASPMLPPHGNLSRDAIRQVLVVRDGATEVARSSRWVIADWSLVHHPKLDEPFDPSSFITDVEWMLHSAFAQLSVSCGRDGVTILSPVQVEMAINDTIDHIREALLRVVVAPPPAMPHSASSSSFGDTVNRRLPTYDVLSDNDYDEDEDSILGSSIVVKFDPEMFQRLQRMPVVEKASFHQAELRREQTFINNTKRKTSLNATVVSSSRGSASGRRSPHRAPQLREEFLVNDAEYELLFLTSPIKVQPSYLLTMPADDDSLSSSTVSQSVPSVLSETAELVVSTPTPRTTLESWKASSSRHATLDDVIDLAVLSQERRTQETKANDDDVRIRREALRALLARNAALEASGHLRNRDDDSGVFRERPSARGHPIVALASMRRTFSSDPSLRSRTPSAAAVAGCRTSGPSRAVAILFRHPRLAPLQLARRQHSRPQSPQRTACLAARVTVCHRPRRSRVCPRWAAASVLTAGRGGRDGVTRQGEAAAPRPHPPRELLG